MTKFDKSYLEKLGEILYDEKKMMNYKTVSIAIGVHVNIAKQMMYHMYKTAKADGKQVFATYYVSGMAPRKVLTNSGSNGHGGIGDDGSSDQPPMDHLETFLVTICRDKDLEDIKSKYTKIFSVHIYSLSGFPIENTDALENLVEFPIRDNEGRTPVDFGPIISSASQKLKDNKKITRSVPNPNIVSKSKSNEVVKGVDVIKKPESTNGLSNNGNGSTQDSQETKSQKLAKPATTEKKDGNRLKSMFATASSKPKSQPKKVESAKPNIKEVKEDPKAETQQAKSVSNRSKDKETRKRKRIRDVLSSDSEEDEKMSEEEEDSSSESTIPRKRIQIESDSDDDFKEAPAKKEDAPLVRDTKDAVPGRKRVAKMVSKTYVNKDGYLVTTKEQVMVSEDEDDQGDKKECKKPDLATSKSSSNESASQKPADRTPVKSNSSGKNANGKTKQASLMSFFQKK